MSIEKVKAYLLAAGCRAAVQEFSVSSATVAEAACALDVQPARIAKTLSFYPPAGREGCLLVVVAGDCKIDNAKFKHTFGCKARMLAPEDTGRLTGHEVGGICPFANPEGAVVYLDRSLERFPTVFPAAGSGNSAVCLAPEALFRYAGACGWVDVCKEG